MVVALTMAATVGVACGASPEDDAATAEEATTACAIKAERSLLIRDPLVVDDPRATGEGPFAIRRLIRAMMPSPAADPDSFAAGTGALPCSDVAELCQRVNEPPRLVAIVNRLDLVSDENPVGELRFVYQRFHEVTHPSARKPGEDPLLGMFINFEFDLSVVRDAAGRPIDRQAWARKLHELDALVIGSPTYFAKLEAITDLVTRRGAAPRRPNGSALRVQRRSSEYWYPARDIWQLQSFKIATPDDEAVLHGFAQPGQLIGSGLDRTPETFSSIRNWRYVPAYRAGDQSSLFALLIDHEAEILDGRGLDFLPRKIGQATGLDPIFRASDIDVMNGSGRYLPWQYNYDGPALPAGWTPTRWDNVADTFGKRTCDGCHGFHTGTTGNHFELRVAGAASKVSAFISDVELPRRIEVAKKLACGPLLPPTPPRDAGAADAADASPPTVVVSAGPHRLSVTGTHACAVNEAGVLKCWGDSSVGQAGTGTHDGHLAPTPVTFLSGPVSAISAGGGLQDGHMHALLAGGAVLGWGANQAAQLGTGTRTSFELAPVAPSGLGNATAISASYAHACAIVAGGVKCWGASFRGEAGAGPGPALAPKAVALPARAMAVETGGGFTCALLEGGRVACWGANDYHQIDATTIDRDLPVLRTDVTNARAVTAGGAHACALLADGRVVCWGSNLRGEIGVPPGAASSPVSSAVTVPGLPSNVVSITAGASHTCALAQGGRAWCWGWSYRGQLGDRTFIDNPVPQPVYAIGGTILELSAGGEQTCARVSGGKIMCWGSNYFGEMGRANPDPSAVPVLVQGF